MHRTFIIVALFGLVAGAGCSKKSAFVEQCVKAADAYVAARDKRSPEAVQHITTATNLCRVACAAGKGDPDACAADDRVVVALCELEGKDACARMCNEDKDEAACAKVKSM
ncbi:hypothetical protein SAMN02745121_06805 [Nannocystis exedens]|uniref:Lipoprotein n=1 Tax=Nannocystis exedens TaxID=54 RepID=A0A1I2FRW1_9BACT|nr:hypothetical protein [Nannocystis exedens]PCC73686.1 hypothetical protein NAEX_06774 [Nannocystis exedens]SFF08144.1 hypothetical protein SAMN02745121_06805 [Nannocystis exedens]